MIVGFVIWSVCAALFVGIGIWCRKSKKPVGFFAGVEPPKVKDTAAYNKAVSRLWLIAAAVFELVGLPLLWLIQNSLAFLPVLLLVPLGVIALAVCYFRIEQKYKA